jgi:hypothetical protein
MSSFTITLSDVLFYLCDDDVGWLWSVPVPTYLWFSLCIVSPVPLARVTQWMSRWSLTFVKCSLSVSFLLIVSSHVSFLHLYCFTCIISPVSLVRTHARSMMSRWFLTFQSYQVPREIISSLMRWNQCWKLELEADLLQANSLESLFWHTFISNYHHYIQTVILVAFTKTFYFTKEKCQSHMLRHEVQHAVINGKYIVDSSFSHCKCIP